MQKYVLSILSLALILVSCKPEEDILIPPHIRFIENPGYCAADSSIAFGELIKVGILAEKSYANLTNLKIEVDTGQIITAFDTSFNLDKYEYTYLVRKSQAEKETWRFRIRDRNGGESSVSFVLTKDHTTAFKPIIHADSVFLYAQLNQSAKALLSFTDFKTYSLEEAFSQQEKMDMFYYYGPENHTIASPGANVETEIFDQNPTFKFDVWTTRNATRYKIYPISSATFDQINNDSLLIIAYGVDEGKRKAKSLQKDQVYSFASKESKLGLFRVVDIAGTDSGYIHLDIKIQE
jgi:hypothetical protein